MNPLWTHVTKLFSVIHLTYIMGKWTKLRNLNMYIIAGELRLTTVVRKTALNVRCSLHIIWITNKIRYLTSFPSHYPFPFHWLLSNCFCSWSTIIIKTSWYSLARLLGIYQNQTSLLLQLVCLSKAEYISIESLVWLLGEQTDRHVNSVHFVSLVAAVWICMVWVIFSFGLILVI